MSSNYPIDPKKKEQQEPFGGLMRSLDQFFHEKPVKNFLQSMDEFFSNPFPSLAFPVSVSETANSTIIKAELPGIKREQIQLDVYSHYLTISIQQEEIIHEENTETKQIHSSQTFKKSSRSIALNHPINEKNIKAAYQNGLLTVTIPKQKGKKILIEE